ncbi:putative NADPH dehydrogenase, partial [Smittium mucronatum]
MKLISELTSPYRENPTDYFVVQSSNPGLAVGFRENGEKSTLAESPDKSLPIAFTPYTQRGITFSNRIFVSPMCMYSSQDGFLTNWHIAHYGGLALHSPGGITVEATAVTHHGRISISCSGLWKDEHIEPHRKVVEVVHSNNVKIGIQLVHSGRKGSSLPLWESRRGIADNSIGGWTDEVYGPSTTPFDQISADPLELSIEQIQEIILAFVDAAVRADKAGYDYIEVHGAHGYLLSSFLSPIVNQRTDNYGGSFTNRIRFLTEVVERVRNVFPEHKPIWVRLSCDEWVEGGWGLEESIKLARILKDIGVDLIDCSTGGVNNDQKIPAEPLFQVPYAQQVKEQADIATSAVGMITTPAEIEGILEAKQSDIVSLARQFLLEPSFVSRAAQELGVDIVYPN